MQVARLNECHGGSDWPFLLPSRQATRRRSLGFYDWTAVRAVVDETMADVAAYRAAILRHQSVAAR